MVYVELVILLALIEYLVFGYAVGRARTLYKVPAPAMSGHPVFDRYFRAQMNTLEQLVVFLPSMWLFARYINAWAAVALGLLFIIGRALYFRGYVQAAESRHAGFTLSAIPTVTLLIGALIGVLRAIYVSGW
jgi:glutathione S-transferase